MELVLWKGLWGDVKKDNVYEVNNTKFSGCFQLLPQLQNTSHFLIFGKLLIFDGNARFF